eukprot:4589174-Amphidinium_carterae.1
MGLAVSVPLKWLINVDCNSMLGFVSPKCSNKPLARLHPSLNKPSCAAPSKPQSLTVLGPPETPPKK